jgi:hypothetical protein
LLEWLMNSRDKARAPQQAPQEKLRQKTSSANSETRAGNGEGIEKRGAGRIAQDCDDFASARWLLFAGQAVAANCAGARPSDIPCRYATADETASL